MKKSLVYLAILVAIVAVIVTLNRQDKQATKPEAVQDFSVENTDSVTKVFIADKSGEKVVLKKSENGWTVNDKYRVMPYRIAELLETLGSLEVKYPVPNAQWDFVIKELATKSKKVEIYLNNEKTPSKVYHVGGHTVDSKGTFMIMEIDGEVTDKPYVMTIPGLQGVLDVRYYTDENLWRHTGIFDYKFEDIQSVTLDYPGFPENSFTLNVIGADSFDIAPLNDRYNIAGPYYKDGVVKFLSSFEYLNAESFQNDHFAKDSLMATTPFLKISVTDKAGVQNKMTVYYMPINKRSKKQIDRQGNELTYDLDHYFALINKGQDFVTIQNFVFGRVFRRYPDFYPKGS